MNLPHSARKLLVLGWKKHSHPPHFYPSSLVRLHVNILNTPNTPCTVLAYIYAVVSLCRVLHRARNWNLTFKSNKKRKKNRCIFFLLISACCSSQNDVHNMSALAFQMRASEKCTCISFICLYECVCAFVVCIENFQPNNNEKSKLHILLWILNQ